ncbi:MAG: Ig-like domain-containing protein [Myxococcota bacterium]
MDTRGLALFSAGLLLTACGPQLRYTCQVDAECTSTHQCMENRCVLRETSSSSSSTSSSASSSSSSSGASTSSSSSTSSGGTGSTSSSSSVTSSSGGSSGASSTSSASSSGGGSLLVVDAQPLEPVITSPISVVFQLKDQAGQPVAGATVGFAGSSGTSVFPTSDVTDENGRVTLRGRVGRTPGTYELTAYHLLGGLSPYRPDVAEPPYGTIITLVNADHTSGESDLPGPGVAARLVAPWGIVVASDRSVFLSQGANGGASRVFKLDPGGILTLVAGGGTGAPGDNGPAVDATLDGPTGLALSHNGNTLYIADSNHDVVRAVDLGTGVITTFAGGGSTDQPNNGDGGQARDAHLEHPTHLTVANGHLYITEPNRHRIRRVDLTSGLISTWMEAPLEVDCTSVGATFYGCLEPHACQVVFDANDNAYLSVHMCGNEIGPGQAALPLVMKRDGGGTLTRVAGSYLGSSDDGISALDAGIPSAPLLALDGAGDLFLSIPTEHRIRRISSGDQTISTRAGTGAPGDSGDLGAADAALLNSPTTIQIHEGHLYLADTANHAIREVW